MKKFNSARLEVINLNSEIETACKWNAFSAAGRRSVCPTVECNVYCPGDHIDCNYLYSDCFINHPVDPDEPDEPEMGEIDAGVIPGRHH